jgi:hypothetical protein
MRPAVAFQSTPVLLDRPDREGQLVFADGQRVALLVRLDCDAPSDDLIGAWFLEAGFGRWQQSGCPVFPSLDAASAWLGRQLNPSALRESGHDPAGA